MLVRLTLCIAAQQTVKKSYNRRSIHNTTNRRYDELEIKKKNHRRIDISHGISSPSNIIVISIIINVILFCRLCWQYIHDVQSVVHFALSFFLFHLLLHSHSLCFPFVVFHVPFTYVEMNWNALSFYGSRIRFRNIFASLSNERIRTALTIYLPFKLCLICFFPSFVLHAFRIFDFIIIFVVHQFRFLRQHFP